MGLSCEQAGWLPRMAGLEGEISQVYQQVPVPKCLTGPSLLRCACLRECMRKKQLWKVKLPILCASIMEAGSSKTYFA